MQKKGSFIMQKTIKIMTIVSVALVGFSLILLLATIPFQGIIMQYIHGLNEHLSAEFPQFPWLCFIRCLICLAFVTLLFFCWRRNNSIKFELIVIICLVFVLPSIERIAIPLYNNIVLRVMGPERGSAVLSMLNFSDLYLIPAGWGKAVAYVTCGMSIAFKKIQKNKTN